MIRWLPLLLAASCAAPLPEASPERRSWPGVSHLDPTVAVDRQYRRPVHGQSPPLVDAPADGTLLTYGTFALHDETDAVHTLPDFSFAGFEGGGVAIPDVPTMRTLSPAAGDDRQRIQDALDAVAALPVDANGHRGAVLLTAGQYAVQGTLRIQASGVVLRGEGPDATTLLATDDQQHVLVSIEGTGSGLDEVSGTSTPVTAAVPVGSREVPVADASGFAVGDPIVVERTPNQDWIDALDMARWGWTASAYAIGHARTVTGVRGNVLTVDIPIVDALDPAFGGGQVHLRDPDGFLQHVGVEDLHLDSVYVGSTDEDHGWTAVELRRVENSWVRRVVAEHFGFSAVHITAESSFNTVEDVAMLDPISQITGSRRYAFHVSDGIGNLFQRVYARNSRHAFVTGSRVTGPNVWLDAVSEQHHNDDGPHHRWATGLLFDNTLSGELHVQNRESSGSGHGWAGAQVLFWNAEATSLICDTPPHAMNWAVGVVGTQNEGSWAPGEDFGTWESFGTPVQPRSLYLRQLFDRLGADAVLAVTTPAQRRGRIWDDLIDTYTAFSPGPATGGTGPGDPTCVTGIVQSGACCQASCGTCGGPGCSQRPGGAAGCCTGTILASGDTCDLFDPPCVLP